MKKLVLLSAILLISCFALKAQTTEIKFFNSSLSDEIKINISDLFEGSISVPRNEVVSIVVDNGRLSAKKYSAEIYYSACGNTEKAELIIGKYNKIGDLREPCEESKIKNCNYPDGMVLAKLFNDVGKDIGIISGFGPEPIALSPNQESLSKYISMGRNTITFETFVDEENHNKGMRRFEYRFLATQDTSCVYKIVVRTAKGEGSEVEECPTTLLGIWNNTNVSISLSSPFGCMSLAPGEKINKKDMVEVPVGVTKITFYYLNEKGDEVSKTFSVIVTKKSNLIEVNKRLLGLPETPRIKENYYRGGTRTMIRRR